jgi:hypothetical protein
MEPCAVLLAVGGKGLKTGGDDEWDATAFGYRSNKQSGEIYQWCTDETDGLFISPVIKMSCPWYHGASGGPWVDEYSSQTGLGYARGVTWGSDGTSGPIYSGKFDTSVETMWDNASDDWADHQ